MIHIRKSCLKNLENFAHAAVTDVFSGARIHCQSIILDQKQLLRVLMHMSSCTKPESKIATKHEETYLIIFTTLQILP